MTRLRDPSARAGLSILAAAVLASSAHGAIEPVSPPQGERVGPLVPFIVNLTAGEMAPSLVLHPSRAAMQRSDAGEARRGDAITITVIPRERPDGSVLLRPIEAIPPGRWIWRVRAVAPRGAAERLPVSAPRVIGVPRVVSMTRARFQRSGAGVRARYVWRTNAGGLIHRVEVFHNGTRVRQTQSTIRWAAGQRMDGREFNASATLVRDRQRSPGILPGTWVVRVTITDGTVRDSAARRFIVR